MKKPKNDKIRNVLFHISAEEIERIFKNNLGGITVDIVISHANVKIDAKTGEDEKVDFYLIK